MSRRVDRIYIPLSMIPGNMEVMLEHTIPCVGVSFRKEDNDDPNPAVVLCFTFGTEKNRDEALSLGLKVDDGR